VADHIVHCHGHDFTEYLPPLRLPVLVTLHLPVDHYPSKVVVPCRPGVYFNCVSASQKRSFPDSGAMLPEIPNGVPVALLQARRAKRQFALALGRIRPEKGSSRGARSCRAGANPSGNRRPSLSP
jgi:hypothetical protein